MVSTHFIIYQKTPADAGIVLDGFKCAYKGTKEEMAKIYRTYYDKAKSLIKMGEATDLKGRMDEDGTIWFKFTHNGIVMKIFLCNRERAAWLLV